jgi:Immunoglobulin I-set domain.
VPSYNWTRKDASLPKSAFTVNYDRVLIIPKVQVEDQGEYVCRAANEKAAIQHSVVLNIQGKRLMWQLFTDTHTHKVKIEWS